MVRQRFGSAGLALVMVCCLLSTVSARPVAEETSDSRVWSSGWHDAGLIRLNITNHGRHGYQNACEWPAGSGDTYIFGAGIWVGCMSDDEALVTVGYDPTNGSTEYVPGNLPNEPGYDDPADRIYWSDDSEDLAEWPITDESGDPIIVSSLDSWCQFNDLDSTYHAVGDTRPIGVRVTQTGYSWNFPVYEDFVFLIYEVENVSGVEISDVYLGVACDADVGDATNDLVGFDSDRNLGYAYTAPPPGSDVSGYVGYDFLESPLDSTGEQLGLTAFKIFTNQGVPPDPGTDEERYLVLAGYNHQTGEYDPYDEITDAQDIRFVQCTGPFDLSPGDTAKVVVAVIAGEDTADLFLNSDVAQIVYDNGFATHDVTVVTPNGGEVLSGTTEITWNATSNTGNPLTVDLFYSRDQGDEWIEITTGEVDDGTYVWNTVGAPDGTWNLVRVRVTDGVLVGEDTSDSLFTINNPGNGVPDVQLIAPNVGQVEGATSIEWAASDADEDELSIDLFYGFPPDQWTAIAGELPNSGSYQWNSSEAINGTYYFRVVAADADTSGVDLSDYQVTVYNHHELYGYTSHVNGGCSSATLLPYVHVFEDTTGHDYCVTFNRIKKGPGNIPIYSYDLIDETTGMMILDDQELSTVHDGAFYTDWSPLFHGISLKIDSQVDQTTFHYVDFVMTEDASGCDADLSISSIASSDAWAFRGSDFELRWQAGEDDSLTLEVWDMTNSIVLPYNDEAGDNWAFARLVTDLSPTYRPGHDRMIWVCGAMFVFDLHYSMTIPPVPGDVWTITAAGDQVPCSGNVYTFGQGSVAVEDQAEEGLPRVFSLGHNVPNPCQGMTTIRYEIPRRSRVTVRIHDLSGRQVVMLVDELQEPGAYRTVWSGTNDAEEPVASGVYFYTLKADGYAATRRLVLLK
jgi:hypothetical protein